MPEVYRTAFAARQEPDTLVIHCSDPHYQRHIQEFLEQHLGLESYELIAVPGGPHFLTLVDYLPKFSWAGWRWVKFLVDVAKPRRAILIGHQDCRWYRDGRFWQHNANLREHQVQDLERVQAGIAERFPGIAVQLYFARLEGEHVVFESV